jgi:4-hydroxy-2-oxoheptanedioate aldolase
MSLAERLSRGEPLTALIAKLPCPAEIEAAGHAGFDLVVLDTEHGPAGALELEHHLRAADAVALPALVRVPSADPPAIGAALDAGATGVVVPHVLDAAHAEAAVAAAHYPPRGRRGFALSTRAGRYGASGWDEHLERAARETVVVVQIEDAEALPRVAEITSVAGVSAAFAGAADLALSIGRPPQAELDAALDAILAAAKVPVMAVADGPARRLRGAAITAFVATSRVHSAFVAAVHGARAPAAQAPLVLLPGMLGDATLWDAVAPQLTVPLRFGRIDLDDSVAAMAESVLAAAPERFALAGHSLGAIVALEVVRRAPSRVTRLALLNASARPASEAQRAAWADMRERTQAGEFAGVVDEFTRVNLPGARDGLPAHVAAMARAVGPQGLLRQLAAQGTRPDARPALAGIAVPTLVVSGARDDVCPTELQDELAAGIPGAQHVTVDGAGHMAPLEEPAAVAAALTHWLGEETP